MRNDSGSRFIELDQETLDFAINNCEININMMINSLQAIHDDKLTLSEDKIRKLVSYIENFRKLKKACEEAK